MKQLSLFEEEQFLTLRDIREIFTESYRELKLGRQSPRVQVQYYPFVGINHTIRLRDEILHVRLSDLLAEAPEPVFKVLSLILLSKLYRRRIHPDLVSTYHSYLNSVEMKHKALQARRSRGRKLKLDPQGGQYDLTILFKELNQEYFNSRLPFIDLGWSRRKSRRILGHFDPSHNSITVSRVFDAPEVPKFVVSYILFHEMLHVLFMTSPHFDGKYQHSSEFRKEEKKFKHHRETNEWLKKHL
ncbi:MAG TPA: SprT-like domain-containing protein [Terriglobia bacterium]|nr:SprT-like domain-containing protein [Terriglobia bacterium]